MRLEINEADGHVRPCELGKLQAVVALLERADEENEAYDGQRTASAGFQASVKGRLTNDIEHKADETMMGRKRQ